MVPAIRRVMLEGLLPRLASQAMNAAKATGLLGMLRLRARHHSP